MSLGRLALRLAPLAVALGSLLTPAHAGASLARADALAPAPAPAGADAPGSAPALSRVTPARARAREASALESELSADDSAFDLFGGEPPSILETHNSESFEALVGAVAYDYDTAAYVYNAAPQLGVRANRSSALEELGPKTRIKVFFVLGSTLIGVSDDETYRWHWGSESLGLGIASGMVPGAWTDPVTGLAYHRARWYDPHNGVWLSGDPLGDVDSPNLYAAMSWRPHVVTDPMGTQTRSDSKDLPRNFQVPNVPLSPSTPDPVIPWEKISSYRRGVTKEGFNFLIGFGVAIEHPYDSEGYLFEGDNLEERRAMALTDVAALTVPVIGREVHALRVGRSEVVPERPALSRNRLTRGYEVEDVRQAESYPGALYERSRPFVRMTDFTDRAGIEKVEIKSLDVGAKKYQVTNVATNDLLATLEGYQKQLEGYERANPTPFNVLEIQLLNTEKLTFAQDQVFRRFVQQAGKHGVLVEVTDYATGQLRIGPN